MNANLPVPAATSLTHQHITAVINTALDESDSQGTVRILDVGCGNGLMIAHLMDVLPVLRPGMSFEVFGMDVADAGQQVSGYMDKTVALLSSRHPSVNWAGRLSLVTTQDTWPYADSSFRFILSNQVMEHVLDHSFVFGQIHRCLQPGGMSINLFPTREILWEGHALMPIVHRIDGVKRRERAMLLFAKLGFRKHYHRDMDRRGWTSLEEFARVFSQVIETDTNYLTVGQLTRTAEKAGLRISFDYTKDFFASKLLSFAGKRPYRYRHLGPLERLAFLVGKRLSSVTVLLKKDR